MSAYINLTTQKYPCYEGDIRLLYPDMGDVFICPEEFELVTPSPLPEYDEDTQSVELLAPLLSNDEWLEQWKVVDLDTKVIKRWKTRPTNTSLVYEYDETLEEWVISKLFGQQSSDT